MAAGIGGPTCGFPKSTDDAYIASDVSVISPKVEGYIKEVRVRENQAVKKGAVLFVIDHSDFAAKVAQNEAAVETEEAAVATYDSRLDLQQAMIAQAQATLQSAEADLVRTQQDYQRYSELMTSDYASRQRFDQAKADLRKAEAETAKSQAALAAAKSQVGVLRSQRREEQARLLTGARQSGAGAERPRQHDDPRAGLRRRRQSRRPGRAIRQARHRIVVAGAAAAGLCHRQFQGDAADPDAARAARNRRRRRLSGPSAQRPDRQLRPGERRPIQPAAARQRHRQLYQDRAAGPGADRAAAARPARPPAAPRPVGHGHGRHPRAGRGDRRWRHRRRGRGQTGVSRDAVAAR